MIISNDGSIVIVILIVCVGRMVIHGVNSRTAVIIDNNE